MGKPKNTVVRTHNKPTKATRERKPKPKAVQVHMRALRNRYSKVTTDLSLKAWVKVNAEALTERYIEKFEGDFTTSPKAASLLG